MSKKTLPKTPESLFDPIEFQRSSRSSTPTPQRSRSRTPTPKISPLRYTGKNQNIPWYKRFLISNITFYTFFILTFLMILTILKNYIPINYCEDNNTDSDCIPCPNNAKCNGSKYECTEDSYPYKDMCIKPGSPDEQAKDLTTKIEELIESNKGLTFSDLRNRQEFQGFSREQIKTAIHLSDKYILNNNGESIDARMNRQSINLILHSALAFCLIIFSLSIFFRTRN